MGFSMPSDLESARLRRIRKSPIAAKIIMPKRTLKTMLGTQTSAEQMLGFVGSGLKVDMSDGLAVLVVLVVLLEQDQIGQAM
jgi:hypothetical protein